MSTRELVLDKIQQYLLQIQKGEYQPRFEKSQLHATLLSMVSAIRPELRDSVLMLTQLRPNKLDALMATCHQTDRTGGSFVRIDYSPEVFDALLRATEEVYGKDTTLIENRIFFHPLIQTIAIAVEHEIWHVMLGDIFDKDKLERYIRDTLYMLAVEIRINDGYIGSAASQCLLNIATLDNLGIREQANDAAHKLGYTGGWLRDEEKVYEVLKMVVPHHTVTATPMPGGAELTIRDSQTGEERTVQIFFSPPSSDRTEENSSGRSESPATRTAKDSETDLMRRIAEMLGDNPNFKYDPYHNRITYSPSGYSDAERDIRPCALVVNWSLIRTILGLKRSVGYNRRTGHLFRSDETPLLTRKPDERKVVAFIDSSGSVDDELISRFIGTVKLSPYQVEIKYFSTEVTDKPHTGGTRFACIEEYLRSLPQYPRTVLVLTDGEDYGSEFEILHPKRWYWIVQSRTEQVERLGGTIIPARRRKSEV